MPNFEKRLRSARIARGLTQRRLADAIGTTITTVSAWENGRSKPRFEDLSPLSHCLFVSLDWLICGTGESPRKPMLHTSTIPIREAIPRLKIERKKRKKA